MAKIKWSKDSIDDLKEICRFIAEDSPYYATLFKAEFSRWSNTWNCFQRWGERFQKPMTLR